MNCPKNISEYFTVEQLNTFLEYKQKSLNITQDEETAIKAYISDNTFLRMKELICAGRFPDTLSRKSIISKEGSTKKRIVYSYENDTAITLKFIAFILGRYDNYFMPCCYAFRHSYGVKNAISRLRRDVGIKGKYCLKLDIKNYFNSIRPDTLLDMLRALCADDTELIKIFENILTEPYTLYKDTKLLENRGAMAGIPIAPFFANVYLTDVDRLFYKGGIDYYRYSDDILIFASDMASLLELKDKLYGELHRMGLHINHSKELITPPGEVFEFLGFSYNNGEIDLAEHTILKLKHKIKRKAHALRRWQQRKGLPPEKAAIGFIKALNRKLYGKEKSAVSDIDIDFGSDFTWSRYFFPNLTVTDGLHSLDLYIQEYIRYAITGRHYKGNYRISYSRLKALGYKSLLHEYYKYKKQQSREHIT